MKGILTSILFILLMNISNAQQSEYFVDSYKGNLDYLLYLPEDYTENREWPLVFFLHGSGERGDDLAKVKIHGPPMLVEKGTSFPFILVSPQLGADRKWTDKDMLFLLETLYQYITEAYSVDTRRVYLTGLSMGGAGTWGWAKKSPEYFAAIAPVCGFSDKRNISKLKDIPIWVFHGGKDKSVPIARSEEMVQWLKEKGADVKFTIYPEANHDSWTETYANPAFYEWLLKQKKAY